MNVLITVVVLLTAMALPLTLAVGMVFREKRLRRREGRRSPLTDKLAHLPGEQLRQRMASLADTIEGHIVQLLVIGPVALLVLLLPRVQWSNLHLSWLDWVVILAAIVVSIENVRRIRPLWHQRAKSREGMHAEIAVAQQLDRLQAQDCLVLHDIPATGFNLDHVVVGQSAVFMVETKSRRKRGEGKASANVTYDGKSLEFPTWFETKPLDQARANARWLAEYLRGETGDSTPVIPVVCLPGWYVQPGKDAHRSDVRVINPKMTSLFVDAGSRPRLDTAHRNRIVNALYKRYPDLDIA